MTATFAPYIIRRRNAFYVRIRIRSRLKDQLSVEMDRIDVIVEKLSTGKSEAHQNTARRARRSPRPGGLFD